MLLVYDSEVGTAILLNVDPGGDGGGEVVLIGNAKVEVDSKCLRLFNRRRTRPYHAQSPMNMRRALCNAPSSSSQSSSSSSPYHKYLDGEASLRPLNTLPSAGYLGEMICPS